jgi:uncharacterized protein (TIRG00374 family)
MFGAMPTSREPPYSRLVSRTIWILTALIITVLALAYACRDVDVQELATLVSGARYWVLAPFLAILYVFFWLKAIRWALILRPLGWFTPGEVAPAMMIGFGGNNLLPARLGEIVRTVVFARQFHQPAAGVFASIVLERVLDVVTLLILYCAALSWLDTVPEALRLSAWAVGAAILTLSLGIVVLLWRPHLIRSPWAKVCRWLPRSVTARIETTLRHVTLALYTMRRPELLVLLLAYSLLQWILMTGMVWLALWAFGTSLPMTTAIVVLVVLALAVAVPSAPGYIGTTQAAFVLALTPFDIAREIALAASTFYLAAQWVPVTLVGIVFFLMTGLRVSQVRRDAVDVERME